MPIPLWTCIAYVSLLNASETACGPFGCLLRPPPAFPQTITPFWSSQALSFHKRNRESLCKPGITHASRLNQGVVGPVAVPSSLEKTTELT